MSNFPPVGPRGRARVAYPTTTQLDPAEVRSTLPLHWARRVGLAVALLSLTGCTVSLWNSSPGKIAADTGDTGIEIIDTGGLDGMIGEEYWYTVTEDEAWAAVEAALQAQGYETLREIRTTVDADGHVFVEARVMDKEGRQVLVGFREDAMDDYRYDNASAVHEGSCAVLPDAQGDCTVVACGDEASAVADQACAVLGTFPYGEYMTYDPHPDHEGVLQLSVSTFLAWAQDKGLVD